MDFALDKRLENDTHLVGLNEHALLLLMNDSRYPWFIVVPRRSNASEWFDLPPDLQSRLHLDCVQLGRCIQLAFGSEKINIGALGNMVRQMHVHVVGRSTGDPAWPGPVWGHSAAIAYTEPALAACVSTLFAMDGLPFTQA